MTRIAVSSPAPPHGRTHTAILGFGMATPPTVTQQQTLNLASRLSGQSPRHQAWLSRVFLRCGIDTRGTVLPDLENFYPPDANPTTAQRMAIYTKEAPSLAHAACSAALTDARTAAESITHLITVSCTGFFAPGLDAALINRLNLSPNVRRLHIGFMGCHGAFNALAAARDAVLADPSAKVLVCCVELCSLHFAYGDDPGKLVANALFADGSAAIVLGCPTESGAGPWNLRATASQLIPDSQDAMTWTIGDHGFEMTLSPTVPDLIRRHLRPWCENWLAEHDLTLSEISHWAIHPGGPKILSAVAEALELPPESLTHSRKILAHHGNMSSATILFILKEIAQQSPAGPCVAIGLGPGLMAEGLLLNG